MPRRFVLLRPADGIMQIRRPNHGYETNQSKEKIRSRRGESKA